MYDSIMKMSADEARNKLYNIYVSKYADYKHGDNYKHGHRKRIPYIGWFWRNTDFVNKRIVIADAGEIIGICVSNKWDYPSRYMTLEEVDIFIGMLDVAIDESNIEQQEVYFLGVWDWFQTLEISK